MAGFVRVLQALSRAAVPAPSGMVFLATYAGVPGYRPGVGQFSRRGRTIDPVPARERPCCGNRRLATGGGLRHGQDRPSRRAVDRVAN
jgi:hypothetical protein